MPRARHDPRLRRVLHRVRLVRRPRRQAAVDPRPAGQRRLARGHPRRPLALQALQPRGLPLRLRRRRPRPGRRAPRGPQEPRPADARPAAARDDRRARRRRARRRAARDATPPAARRCARRSSRPGFRIDHSEASLYLWATRGQDCWETVADLADQGILVAPGEFYGPPAASTCGSPSPRPTSGSRRRSPGSRAETTTKRTADMRVTVLGTGIMGTGMARSLLREGHEVTVWNRTADRAAAARRRRSPASRPMPRSRRRGRRGGRDDPLRHRRRCSR